MLGFIAWYTVSALVAFPGNSPRAAINMLWDWVGLERTLILARQLIDTLRESRGR